MPGPQCSARRPKSSVTGRPGKGPNRPNPPSNRSTPPSNRPQPQPDKREASRKVGSTYRPAATAGASSDMTGALPSNRSRAREPAAEAAGAGRIDPDDLRLPQLLRSITMSAARRQKNRVLYDAESKAGGPRSIWAPRRAREVGAQLPDRPRASLPAPSSNKAYVQPLTQTSCRQASGSRSFVSTCPPRRPSPAPARPRADYQPRPSRARQTAAIESSCSRRTPITSLNCLMERILTLVTHHPTQAARRHKRRSP